MSNNKKIALYLMVVSFISIGMTTITSNQEDTYAEGNNTYKVQLESIDLPKYKKELSISEGSAALAKELTVESAPSPLFVSVTTDYLNVREQPEPIYTIIDVLPKSWVVKVTETTKDNWYQIEGGGYLNAKYTINVDSDLGPQLILEQQERQRLADIAAEAQRVAQQQAQQEAERIEVIQRAQQESAHIAETVQVATVTTTVVTPEPEPVQQTSSSSQFSSSDIDLLARLVRAEANTEPYSGKVAVAKVVLNRINSNEFPDTIQAVIYQPRQFTPVSDGSINQAATSESINATHEAINTIGYDNDGSLFFYNPHIATSRWLDSRATSKVIGNHVFKY